MPQVCPSCQHVHEGAPRFRCPKCRSPYNASMFDVPRYAPAPHEPEPEPEPEPPPVGEPAPERKLRLPRRERQPEPRHRARPEEPPPPPIDTRPAAGKDSRPFDINATSGIEGFDISSLNIAKKSYHVELPDKSGEWRKLYSIVGTIKTPAFGRNIDPRLQAMRWMARKHVRFENTSRGLFVLPYESLNGVYRRLTRPAEMAPGTRFRIGNYIMTYREALMPEPEEPLLQDGELLLARDLKPLGFIEFLRPDGQVGVRYPILKPSGIVLGRGGPGPEGHVDLPLAGDPKVSARHARLTWQRGDGDFPFLEDLDSKSGTWILVEDRAPVASGDIFWLGELYLRVVEDR